MKKNSLMPGKLFFFLFTFFFTFELFAADALFERAKARYDSTKSSASAELKKRELLEAAQEFKQVVDRSDPSPHRAEALYYLGMIHQTLSEGSKDPKAAGRSLHYYRTLVKDHKNHRLADDSWLEIAKICSDVFSDTRCATEARQKVARKYSSTKSNAVLEVPATALLPAENLTLERITFEDGDPEKIQLWFRDSKGAAGPSIGVPRFESKYLGEDLNSTKNARFFLDLQSVKLDSKLQAPATPKDSKLVSVRFGQFTKDIARVVLDLQSGVSQADLKVDSGNGLSVSLGESGTKEIQTTSASPEVSKLAMNQKAQTAKKDPPEPAKKIPSPLPPKPHIKRIVLDAGHGGHDPGARGKRGTNEKDICLSLTKKVEKILKKSGQYEIFMTRTDDRYLSLLERTKFANDKKGDLFISIHANASPKRSARGVSTYFLDNADDEESLRVAMRENGELSIEQFSADHAKDDDYFLEVMKASMVKNFHTTQSTDLARHIQNMLMSDLSRSYSKVRDLGVRSAKFYVLTGATMPAVLVETSFISNDLEEKRLKDPRYQDRLAQAIVKGIENYIKSSVGKGDHTALYQP